LRACNASPPGRLWLPGRYFRRDYGTLRPPREPPPGRTLRRKISNVFKALIKYRVDSRISMQRNLFSYIWRHSRHEQLVILSLVVLAQLFYFLSLSVPKSIVNNGISGNAFKDAPTVQMFAITIRLSRKFCIMMKMTAVVAWPPRNIGWT